MIWQAKAVYADGASIEATFPYDEGGNYLLESCRQYEIEEWLIRGHEGCTWYSVDAMEEEDEL